jgi:Tfp pilus assembly protein FimV
LLNIEDITYLASALYSKRKKNGYHMVCDHKHKYIATVALNFIAFGCISLGFLSTALALGLSDIDVHSSLGEPLKANITVLGVQDLTSASCLTLGPDSDIKHINFKLSPAKGGTANVSLTSNTVINKPIINLSVIVGCNHSIARHYVLLLAPPFSTQSLDTRFKNLSLFISALLLLLLAYIVFT